MLHTYVEADNVCAILLIPICHIKGIKIDNKEIKISLFEDDIMLILKGLLSPEKALKTVKLFQHCSGVRLNINKTTAQKIL